MRVLDSSGNSQVWKWYSGNTSDRATFVKSLLPQGVFPSAVFLYIYAEHAAP